MDPPETRYARTDDGLSIAYQTLGEGSTDVVILLSGSAIDVLWDDPVADHVLRRLARIGRLICFDWRGFGSSDPVPLGALPTPEAWMDDIRVVLDAAGSVRAHLVGTSSVGPLGVLFAATYPRRTASLTLVDTFARSLWAEDFPIGASEEIHEAFARFLVQGWGTSSLARAFFPSRADDDTFVRFLGRLQRLGNSPATANATMRWTLRQDVRAVLDSVRVPTLVVHSASNPAVPIDHGRYLAEHIAGARLVVRTGAEDFLLARADGDEVVDHVEEFITGVRPVREPDRALATVLFTDIVASTELAARVGDQRWSQMLDDHDALIGRELDRHRGRRVKHTGDGVLASFDGPARAVRCAQSICTAARSLGLEVRAGLHTGEVELRGDDIGGIAVHIGRRVSALAGPGEVLVSRTVTDLVVGSGLEFEERGTHELKGVPGKWTIYAVAPDDR